jgi:alkaline phosphatase
LHTETHSGEDVPIYASGPGAHLISGSNEQTIIFHAMNHAGGLLAKAKRALKK